jgi:hypothetical protein
MFLVTNVSSANSSASIARWLTLHKWTLNFTLLTRSLNRTRSVESHSPERTHREHRLQHLFYCVTSPRTRMLRALRSSGCTRHVSWHLLYCCLRALSSNGYVYKVTSIRHNTLLSRCSHFAWFPFFAVSAERRVLPALWTVSFNIKCVGGHLYKLLY